MRKGLYFPGGCCHDLQYVSFGKHEYCITALSSLDSVRGPTNYLRVTSLRRKHSCKLPGRD